MEMNDQVVAPGFRTQINSAKGSIMAAVKGRSSIGASSAIRSDTVKPRHRNSSFFVGSLNEENSTRSNRLCRICVVPEANHEARPNTSANLI